MLRYMIGKTRLHCHMSFHVNLRLFTVLVLVFNDMADSYVSDSNRDSGWPGYKENCAVHSLKSISMGRCWQRQSRVEISAASK